MIDSVPAEITQTPAASPSTPSIRLITLITATMPTIVSTWPRWTSPTSGRSKSSTLRRSTPPMNGSVNTLALTPLKTGIAAARLPGELRQRRQLEDVVEHPDDRDHRRPASRRRASGPSRQEEQPVATTAATKIARPPSFGRRAPVEAALAGPVDRADLPGEPLGERDEQPGEQGRDAEREQGVDRGRSAVDEHQPAPEHGVDE